MKKRILTLLAAVTASALLMTACAGGSGSDETPVSNPFPTNPGTVTPTDPGTVTTSDPGTVTPSAAETPTPIQPTPTTPSTVNVKLGGWENIEWEQYTSVYFTMYIPKGWVVEWNGNSDNLIWMATNPEKNTGMMNIAHDYAAKDPNMTQMLGMNKSLTYGTVEEYFKTLYSTTTDYYTPVASCVPSNKDQIQQLRPDKLINDYQTIYATYSENGVPGEGVYSCVIMEAPDRIIRGNNYASWEINGILAQFCPLGELMNWKSVFQTMIKSFAYTDYFYDEILSKTGTSISRDAPSNNDVVLEAFEERSESDTIIQEKRSDMIGEYERVYDNDSGQIYRAYNGFYQDIGGENQSKYTPITDQQYTQGYVGWIEK